MKIKNKFDMLDAMSDINEEYVRKADRLLAQHRTGEAAVKMEITPMKFSWKSIAAAAACLAVLIGGTFGIKALMNRPHIVKPVDVLTPAQQAYLDEWKEKIGANVDIAYAVDRLTFIEIELPEDVSVTQNRFIDENRAVFLREAKRDDKPYKTLEVYNIREKTYSVAAELDAERTWNICYADKDYVLYQSCKGSFGTDDNLYLYDVNTAQNHFIYEDESNTELAFNSFNIAADGKVYFTAYDHDSGMPSLHVYDIESGRELEVIKGADAPRKCKGDIVYCDISEGELRIRSIGGKYNFNGDAIVTNYGLYRLEYESGRLIKLETGKDIISAYTHEGLINLDDSCDFALQFGGRSLNSTEASESALSFIFYAPTDEILVFQDGDGFSPLNCFGWGATISKRDPDGTVRQFIVTDKESEYAVKIPKIDPQPEEIVEKTHLEKMKDLFGAQGSVDYALNKLDIKEYDISGFDDMPVLADKDRAVVTARDSDGCPELRIHDLGSGKETTLYSRADDPEITSETDIDVLFANKDYAVFTITFFGGTFASQELRMVELAAHKQYTVCSPWSWLNRKMVIDGNALYFTIVSDVGVNGTIYRYDIGSGNDPKEVGYGSNISLYDGKLYYVKTDLVVNELGQGMGIYSVYCVGSDELLFDFEVIGSDNFVLGNRGCFVRQSDGIVLDLFHKTTVLRMDDEIDELRLSLYEFALLVGDDSDKAIYNANTGELLVFDEDTEFYNEAYCFEFDGGMYALERAGGVYNKLCVITEKGAQNETKPNTSKVERNYVSNVPEAKLSDVIEIRSEDFSLPEKIIGYNYSEMGFADRTKLKVLLLNDKKEYIEYGIYDIENGNYLTVFNHMDAPQSGAVYGQSGRYVYCPGKDSMWVAADIESDPHISKAKVFEIGKGAYHCDDRWSRTEGMALGADGKLYFSGAVKEPVYDEYGNSNIKYTDIALFRFDPESGETEKLMNGAFAPHALGDEILYETYENGTNEYGSYSKIMLKSLSGKISLAYDDFYQPSDNYRSGIMLCGSKIFGTVNVVPDEWDSDKQLINVLTGEVILQTGNKNVTHADSDNIIHIDTFEEDDMELLYFIEENKLVPINKGDAPYDGIIRTTYDGLGLITWSTGLTFDGKLYTFSMK